MLSATSAAIAITSNGTSTSVPSSSKNSDIGDDEDESIPPTTSDKST